MKQLLYSQSWEDPRTLREALDLSGADRVLSIGAAGDNSFALLLDGPGSLTVIDRSPVQLHLIELKVRAIETLDYDDFIVFIGARSAGSRTHLYDFLRPSLSSAAAGYWDGHQEEIARGVIHCGKLERYFSLFRRAVLPVIHGERTVERLLAASTLAEQRTLYHRVWNNRRWRWVAGMFLSGALLRRLGREDSFFRHVTVRNIGGELLGRVRRGVTEVPIRDNFFMEYILTGGYRDLRSAHPYLAESNFRLLKERAGTMELVHGDLEEYLKRSGAARFSKFNLSDIFEYMSDEEFQWTLREILQAGRHGAKMAYWSLFVPREVPRRLSGWIRPCPGFRQRFLEADRSFFYRDFSLCYLP